MGEAVTYGFYAPNVVTMADCACCGREFEADSCDPAGRCAECCEATDEEESGHDSVSRDGARDGAPLCGALRGMVA